jgi:hypothetical protein
MRYPPKFRCSVSSAASSELVPNQRFSDGCLGGGTCSPLSSGGHPTTTVVQLSRSGHHGGIAVAGAEDHSRRGASAREVDPTPAITGAAGHRAVAGRLSSVAMVGFRFRGVELGLPERAIAASAGYEQSADGYGAAAPPCHLVVAIVHPGNCDPYPEFADTRRRNAKTQSVTELRHARWSAPSF